MELKNALSVCLISLVSATLVLLTARALDVRSAARLEPQLTRIVEELEAIRKQGNIAVTASPDRAGAAAAERQSETLFVYSFHSNTPCATCRSIESQAREAVYSGFADEAQSGRIVWKTLNYEQDANASIVQKFDVIAPIVVLAKVRGGEIEQWKSLDEVWGLHDDRPAYAAFMRSEINKMLGRDESQNAPTPDQAADSESNARVAVGLPPAG